ncbi:DNA-directed RNA polymerase III subunit RPC9 isoform X3 [Cervus elaphus]|uniref:DNA-directed RNA polymerase III subunit RPC9 isoform X3 n=1 Tax=Cervus elaphus TaxID=9860 RepID=UPI001CC29A68|nr:DNA-directed RNA polymerase III subunit RPC9 isoform X3 [Cervus elaphus]
MCQTSSQALCSLNVTILSLHHSMGRPLRHHLSVGLTSRKDANAALLSNYEVFQLLTDLKEQRKESGKNKHSSGQQNLNTITYETLKYISKTPCKHQSPEIVREFLTAMKSHKLTKWWRRVRNG